MIDLDSRLTARLPSAALAALCTSVSWLPNRNRIGSRVSRPTSRTSFSVISANANAADRWRSTLSLNDKVVRDASGAPVKKLVVCRSKIGELDPGRDRTHLFQTYSPGDEAAPILLPARSPGVVVRTRASVWGRLRMVRCVSLCPAVKVDAVLQRPALT